MVVRKTKEDRSIRETQPVMLPVKQKESLSYMNFREFTPPLLVLTITSLIVFSIRGQLTRVEEIPFRSQIIVINFIYGVWNPS